MVHVVSKMKAPEWSEHQLTRKKNNFWICKTIVGNKTTKGVLTLLDLHSQKLNKGITIKIWIAKKVVLTRWKLCSVMDIRWDERNGLVSNGCG